MQGGGGQVSSSEAVADAVPAQRSDARRASARRLVRFCRSAGLAAEPAYSMLLLHKS